jgi:hypothetical protein
VPGSRLEAAVSGSRWHPTRAERARARRARFRSKLEVVEGALAIEIGDAPRHRAATYLGPTLATAVPGQAGAAALRLANPVFGCVAISPRLRDWNRSLTCPGPAFEWP